MSEWWNGLSDKTIDRLKQHVYVFEDLDTVTEGILNNIPLDDLIFRDMYGRWGKVGSGRLCRGLTYRLRPDWYRPTPETKQAPFWEECEIQIRHLGDGGGWYFFQCRKGTFDLVNAFSMVGFGGIKYKEVQQWYGYLNTPSWDDGKKPVIPIKVRFWVGDNELES